MSDHNRVRKAALEVLNEPYVRLIVVKGENGTEIGLPPIPEGVDIGRDRLEARAEITSALRALMPASARLSVDSSRREASVFVQNLPLALEEKIDRGQAAVARIITERGHAPEGRIEADLTSTDFVAEMVTKLEGLGVKFERVQERVAAAVAV